MENNKTEPTLDEYGLDASSYENYKNQKRVLEKDFKKITNEKENKIKDSESKIDSVVLGVYYLMGFLLSFFFIIKEESFVARLFSSLFLGILFCYILIIFFEVIFSFFNINISESLLKNNSRKDIIDKYSIKIREIDLEIQILKNKIYPFEKACSNYYTNYLKQFYDSNLYKKHSGTEKFDKSVAEFSSLLNEVDDISKKMQTSSINTSPYKSYLEGRKINNEYNVSKKFNTFNNIDSKLSSAYEIESKTQEKNQNTDFAKKVAESIFKEKQIPISDVINNKLEKLENIPSQTQDNSNKESINFWDNLLKDANAEIDQNNNPSSPINEVTNTINEASPDKKYNTPRKIDWENINKNKAITGLRGEEIVLETEKNYLKSINREDLAEKVKHMSIDGDGSGYDILSYFPDGKEKYIEVKSSKNSNSNSFNMSSNELDFMKINQYSYQIYQIFNVNEKDELPTLKVHRASDILEFKKITPVQYVVKME